MSKSLTSLLFRAARLSADGRAVRRGPAAVGKRIVRKQVYRRGNTLIAALLRGGVEVSTPRIRAAIGNMRTHLWLDAKKNPVWVLVDRQDLEVILAYVNDLERESV